jgi:hypothetical protein
MHKDPCERQPLEWNTVSQVCVVEVQAGDYPKIAGLHFRKSVWPSSELTGIPAFPAPKKTAAKVRQ